MIRSALLTVFLVPLLPAPALADADGTILSREVITLADDLPARLHALVEGVTLERIIYVSAGLEVEGYLAYPSAESEEALPCLVFCRGGNRDFGGLDDASAAFLLGESAQAGYVVVASNYRGNGELGARLYPPERTCPECP